MYLKRFRRPGLENLQRQALCKAVNTAARKVVYCPYCAATNGAVKKAGALRIVHDKFRAKKTAEELERFRKSFANAVEAQKELAVFVNRAVMEDLNPLKVLDLFKRMLDEVRGSMQCPCEWYLNASIRTASCSVSGRLSVDQKSSFGNIYLFLLPRSVRPLRRMVHRTKTISPSS